MKPGRSVDYIKMRQYKRLAREVIHDGGNLSELARRAGVSAPFMSRYMRKHAPCLHERLKEAKSRRTISPEAVLNRLRTIHKAKSQREAGRILGLSGMAISYTLRVYAPDGLEEALAEYEATYGAPLFEEAA